MKIAMIVWKLRKYVLFIFLLSTFAFHLQSPAHATNITASVFALQPFGGIDRQGNITGIIPEIIDEIQKETGLTIDVKVVPYKRMFQELRTGKTDFAIFFRTSESEKIAIPKVRVYTLKNIVVGKIPLNLHRYEDIIGPIISLPNGTFYQKKFDTDPALIKNLVPGFSNAVDLLLNGRTSLIAGPELSIAYLLKQKGFSTKILGKPYALSLNSAWLQVSAKSKELTPNTIAIIVKAVFTLRRNNTIDNILQKYR